MTLTLIYDGCLSRMLLPTSVIGRYWFYYKTDKGVDNKFFCVEGLDNNWCVVSNSKVQVMSDYNTPLRSRTVEIRKVFRVRNYETGKYGIIFAVNEAPDDFRYCNYSMPNNTKICIGRDNDCDISYNSSLNLVSTPHAFLCRKGYNWMLIDNNSSNGTYVNGNIIRGQQELHFGDLIFIMGLVIIIGKDFICMNNPEGILKVNKKLSRIKTNSITNQMPDDYFQDEMKSEKYFYISPRINKKNIQAVNISIDPPPQKQSEDQQSLILTLGPSITMGLACAGSGVFSVISAFNTGNISSAIPTLIICFSMLLGTTLWPILSKRSSSKERAKREKKRKNRYTKYLSEKTAEIEQMRSLQCATLRDNIVPIEGCINRATEQSRSLWERLSNHDDFLLIRLGLGDMSLIGSIKYPEKKLDMNDDELLDEMYKICNKKYDLHKVPISLSLLTHTLVGAYGAKDEIIPFIKGIIIQLATLQSYSELKMVFVIDEQYAEEFAFARWLPHVWNQSRSFRFFATNEVESKEVSSALSKEFEFRKSETAKNTPNPHFVIFCMGRRLFSKNEAINTLLSSNGVFGVSAIFSTVYEKIEDMGELPPQCNTIIELNGQRSRLIMDKSSATVSEQLFSPDIYVYDDEANKLSHALSNIESQDFESISKLPTTITFLQMYDVGKVEHLNVWHRWTHSNSVLSLSVPIGVDSNGSLVNLDIHQNFQGSHGLIGGTTGSGKSELVKTFILSLAVNFSPDDVTFIIIDYKGGNLADTFKDLPHTKGIITNLDGTAVKRSLASIKSEILRREDLMRNIGLKVHDPSLDIYGYQELQKNGQLEPLPHLVIICDEFAELKDDKPEFMDELVSVARTGRAYGVHLVLCTQSPGNAVNAEIWKNSKFHICLQVDKNESMEILKSPEGANLPHRGSFYLHTGTQPGNRSNMSLGQSAWPGAKYIPADHVVKERDDSVVAISNTGTTLVSVKPMKKYSDNGEKKQAQAIISHIISVAKEHNIKTSPLWLAPIPSFVSIDDIRSKYKHSSPSFVLNPVIGEYDDPSHQCQNVLTVPFTSDGNVVLFGMAGSGRSVFISTLLYSLMSDHAPNELSIYVLDMSSEALSIFKEAPQIGDIIFSEETEKITNLFTMLKNEVTKRKKILSTYGGEFKTYVDAGNTDLPDIVLVINNYPAFKDEYERESEMLIQLSKDCIKYGIYMVLSVTNYLSIRSSLLSNIKQRFAFQMNDDTEYGQALGMRTGDLIPASDVGRGLVKIGNTALEFQTARFVRSTVGERDFIMEFVDKQRAKYGSGEDRRIRILPQYVKLENVQHSVHSKSKAMPIGISKKNMEPLVYDFGKYLASLALSQVAAPGQFSAELAKAMLISEARVIYIDAVGDVNKENVVGCEYVAGSEPIKNAIKEIIDECRIRSNSIVMAERKSEPIPAYDNIFVLIHSMAAVYRILKDTEFFVQMKGMLSLARLASNVVFVIDDSVEGYKAYRDDEWCKNAMSRSDGIWIGGNFTVQSIFTLTQRVTREEGGFNQDFGYTIVGGIPKPFKALTTRNGDDDQ